jgi:hypothetical protein
MMVIAITGAISYMIYGASDTYKNILKNTDEDLKEVRDKRECLQKSQIYNHITGVEKDNDELKSLILQRLTDVESCDVQMAEVK